MPTFGSRRRNVVGVSARVAAPVNRCRRRPPARRNRPDGIREATLSYFAFGYQRFVPFLRLRGHWLASFGFKTRTRIYIKVSQGCLVITVKDPAQAEKAAQSLSKQPGTVAGAVAARVGPRQRVSAVAIAVAAQHVVRRA